MPLDLLELVNALSLLVLTVCVVCFLQRNMPSHSLLARFVTATFGGTSGMAFIRAAYQPTPLPGTITLMLAAAAIWATLFILTRAWRVELALGRRPLTYRELLRHTTRG